MNGWNNELSNSSVSSNTFGSSSEPCFHPVLFPTTILDPSNSLNANPSLGFSMLKCLDLRNCKLLEFNFLMMPSYFSMLKDLDLSGNNCVSLPASIRLLTNLRSLKLSKCKKLQEIPELPQNIKRVEARDCNSLEKCFQLARIEESSSRPHDIDLSNCHKLAEHQGKVLDNALLIKVDLLSH